MIRVIVDSRVRFSIRELGEDLTVALKREFTHRNHKRAAMERMKIPGFWSEPHVLATWAEDGAGELSLPRGGLARVREILGQRGEACGLSDRRVTGTEDDFDAGSSITDSRVSLWPHQERIVQACLAKQNCLIRSGTGSGKTSALLALVARAKLPSLVVVHSTKLQKQWVERAASELGMRERDVGTLGGGKAPKLRDLTIGIQKSVAVYAKKNPAFLKRWGLVAADEVHLFAASSFFAAIDPFFAKYRIGVSDDAKRKDKKEFLIYDLFGPEVCEVSDEELVAGGHVMPVEVMIVPTRFEAPWYGIPDDDDAEKRPDYGRLLSAMSEDAERNAIVENLARSERASGRQVLVFASERLHCRVLSAALADLGAGHLIGGSDYGSEYDRTIAGLRNGKVGIAVGTYQACGTGTDLPSVEVGIAVTPVLANKSRFRQSRGRLCRKPVGKTVARLYVLWDPLVHGIRHLENALRWNGPGTFVWDGTEWVTAKAYLKRSRIAG